MTNVVLHPQTNAANPASSIFLRMAFPGCQSASLLQLNSSETSFDLRRNPPPTDDNPSRDTSQFNGCAITLKSSWSWSKAVANMPHKQKFRFLPNIRPSERFVSPAQNAMNRGLWLVR
jgi:hypothetical protein